MGGSLWNEKKQWKFNISSFYGVENWFLYVQLFLSVHILDAFVRETIEYDDKGEEGVCQRRQHVE